MFPPSSGLAAVADQTARLPDWLVASRASLGHVLCLMGPQTLGYHSCGGSKDRPKLQLRAGLGGAVELPDSEAEGHSGEDIHHGAATVQTRAQA